MPRGAQRVDFLLMLTQNYIPVLLATGTAVVKNTFSTLDACCWKKKKIHIDGHSHMADLQGPEASPVVMVIQEDRKPSVLRDFCTE